jgi:threonine aldolase
MFFASDNGGPVHPRVMAALVAANEGHARAYGTDALMDQVRDEVRQVLGAPEAAVYLVATGTAANALALATLTPPWATVFCTKMAHLNEDECNAPEFFTGGAKLTLVADRSARIDPAALDQAIRAEGTRGVHGPQRGPVAVTQATEKGTIYALGDLAAITRVARAHGLPVHMDGARFANALVRLGCSAAEMTSGLDAISFGGSKNGLMGVEAVVLFDPAKAWEFELRRKRAGHLVSKGRYLAAQMAAWLEDGLWLDLARTANALSDRLAAGLAQVPEVTLEWEPQANLIFFRAPRGLHQRLLQGGAYYYVLDGDPLDGHPDERLLARLVCDWSVGEAAVERFLALAGR